MKETALDKAIMAAIRKRGGWCWKVHGGPYQAAGIPDIVGVYRGVFVGIEDKVHDNVLSAIQAQTLARITRAGGYGTVAFHEQDAEDLMDLIDRHREIV